MRPLGRGPSEDVHAVIAGRGRSPLNHRQPQPRQTNCRMERPLCRSMVTSSLSGAWHFQQRMPSDSECIDCIMTRLMVYAQWTEESTGEIHGSMVRPGESSQGMAKGICVVRERDWERILPN